MRIHASEDGVANYIGSLAKSISIDPSSMESWLCMHVCFPRGLLPALEDSILERLMAGHPKSDCEVFCCKDTDIFIVSRTLSAAMLYQLCDEIIFYSGAQTVEVNAYDLCQHWRSVRDLLIEKSGDLLLNNDSLSTDDRRAPISCFGDTSALADVFREAAQQRRTRSPLYIMLVEDDPMTQRVVTEILIQDYRVIQASTAYDAVVNYMMHAPDLVFLDIGLPDTSGMKVLQQLVQSDPHAYIIMFSGSGDLDNILTAFKSGASGFITKPFSRRKLTQYIENAAVWHDKHMEA